MLWLGFEEFVLPRTKLYLHFRNCSILEVLYYLAMQNHLWLSLRSHRRLRSMASLAMPCWWTPSSIPSAPKSLVELTTLESMQIACIVRPWKSANAESLKSPCPAWRPGAAPSLRFRCHVTPPPKPRRGSRSSCMPSTRSKPRMCLMCLQTRLLRRQRQQWSQSWSQSWETGRDLLAACCRSAFDTSSTLRPLVRKACLVRCVLWDRGWCSGEAVFPPTDGMDACACIPALGTAEGGWGDSGKSME